VIEAVFALLTLRILLTLRKEMDAAFSPSPSPSGGSYNVSKNHFIRLLSLSGLAIFLHLPLSLWILIANATPQYNGGGVAPWISWDDTHSNYGRIAYITRFAMQQSPEAVVSMSVMLFATTLSAFNYFFLFGFGGEAMRRYRRFVGAVVGAVRRGGWPKFGVEYPREVKRRTGSKRAWHGFGKGGDKAVNPTLSMRHLDPNPSGFYGLGTSDSFFSQTSSSATGATGTVTGDNDIYIDMTNLDVHKAHRTGISSFDSTTTVDPHRWRDSATEGKGEGEGEGKSWEITDIHKGTKEDSKAAPGEPSVPNRDLEAQELEPPPPPPPRSESRHARRLTGKASSEEDPELTEEVTF
jgi:Pheromone A receptor